MSNACELLGLVVVSAPVLTTPASGLSAGSAGNASSTSKNSPVSCTSTRTNSPGGSSTVSFEEGAVTPQRSHQSVDAGMLAKTRELVLSDLGIDSPETLAQRRQVRELMLSDLGIDCPDTSSAPSTAQAPSAASACPTDRPPCLTAPRTPPAPAHTPCVDKTPTCVAGVASACEVLSASPVKGCDASQRSPAPRPGFDASQRSVSGREIANRIPRAPRVQPLGDVTLRTPTGNTSAPLNIVSTCPTAPKSTTSSHDASARSPVACPNIVSTCPTVPKSTTPSHDASARSPAACSGLNSPVDAMIPALNVVSTCPTAPKSTTPSHDASARSPAACPGLKSPLDATNPQLNIVSTCPTTLKLSTPSQDASTRSLVTCAVLVSQKMQTSTVIEPVAPCGPCGPCGRSDAVKCWLLGAGSAAALSGEELAETLRAAAPETYED